MHQTESCNDTVLSLVDEKSLRHRNNRLKTQLCIYRATMKKKRLPSVFRWADTPLRFFGESCRFILRSMRNAHLPCCGKLLFNYAFRGALVLKDRFVLGARVDRRQWVTRYLPLQSTHVYALGLIAVASKFVGVCHGTANCFFRETCQLLTSCWRCGTSLRSHACLICTSKYLMCASCATRCFCVARKAAHSLFPCYDI